MGMGEEVPLPVRSRTSLETGMSCSYGRFYCKQRLHYTNAATQLMMSQTVTHICTTKYQVSWDVVLNIS